MPAKFDLGEANKNQRMIVSKTEDVFKLLPEEIVLTTKDSNLEMI